MWHFDPTDGTKIDVWDHTKAAGDAPTLSIDNSNGGVIEYDDQGIPITPDVRAEVLDYLNNRGKVDMFAIRTVAEALTGAGFEEGSL